MKFIYGVSVVGAILGGAILIQGLANANGAPQEAAAAAIAVAVTIIPYCIARGMHGIHSINAETRIEELQQSQASTLRAIAAKWGINT